MVEFEIKVGLVPSFAQDLCLNSATQMREYSGSGLEP